MFLYVHREFCLRFFLIQGLVLEYFSGISIILP